MNNAKHLMWALLSAALLLLLPKAVAQQRSGLESITSAPAKSGMIEEMSQLVRAQAELNDKARVDLDTYQKAVLNVGQRGAFTDAEKAALDHHYFSAVTSIRATLTNALGYSSAHLQHVEQVADATAQLAGDLGARIAKRAAVLSRMAQQQQISEDDIFLELTPQEQAALRECRALAKEADLLVSNGRAHIKQLNRVLQSSRQRNEEVQSLRDKARAAYNDFALYDRIYRQMLQDAVDEGSVIEKDDQHRAEVEALREYQKQLEDTGRLAPTLSVRNQGTNSLHSLQ